MMIFESAARWRTSPSIWKGTVLIVTNSTRLTYAWARRPMVAARSAMAAIRDRWPCRRDTTSNGPSWGRPEMPSRPYLTIRATSGGIDRLSLLETSRSGTLGSPEDLTARASQTRASKPAP